jgi:hypothetical protein
LLSKSHIFSFNVKKRQVSLKNFLIQGEKMQIYTPPLCLYVLREMNVQCQGSATPPSEGTLIPIDCDVEEVSCAEGATPTSDCVTFGNSAGLAIGFTLVGSTSTETPNCSVTYGGTTYSDCDIPLQFICDDGVYWQIRCDVPACPSSAPATLECEGAFQPEPCEEVRVFEI